MSLSTHTKISAFLYCRLQALTLATTEEKYPEYTGIGVQKALNEFLTKILLSSVR